MCSSRCEIPAWLSSSAAEPVPIQKPSATERTLGTRSVTTLTPESSVVMRCSASGTVATTMARATGATLAVAARTTVAAAVASTAVAVARRARAAATAATADAGQLLDGLARDIGVIGQAQADTAALAVDLDHAHVDLVAFVEHVLDR